MNFGYTTKGGSTLVTGKFFASRFICPDAGILNSVSVYLKNDSGSAQNIQIGIFNDAAGAVGTALIYSATLSLPIGFDDWRTVSLAGNLLLGGAYWLTVQLENSASIVYLYYDAGSADQGAFKEAWTFGDWADNPAGLTYSTNKISISAAYTYVNPNSYSWFQMPKSQIDPERMEEAIARLILEHEQDEESHLGVGESLQSHKASEIIDHVANSIIADKILAGEVDLSKMSDKKFTFRTNFETVANWNGIDSDNGVHSDVMFEYLIGTYAVAGAFYDLTNQVGMVSSVIDFSKNPFFQTTFAISSMGAQEFYAVIGHCQENNFGFMGSNNVLYAHTRKGATVHNFEITGITLSVWNVYRAVMDSVAGTIEFYVNGVSKATLSADLPSGTSGFLVDYYIYGNAGHVCYVYLRDCLIELDK